MPYTFSQAVWNAKAVSDTVELQSEFERCAVTVIEITTVAFSGTIDIQGKAHELSAYANVPYIRQDQASIQTPSVTQVVPAIDTGVYRYVVLGYWRRLQIVMTRTVGTITCGVAGSSNAKVFPYLVTQLIAGVATIGNVGLLTALGADAVGVKETAISQETGATGIVGWLSSAKGFLKSIRDYIGITTIAAAVAGGVGSVNAKLRLMTTQLASLVTGIVLAAGSAIIGRVLPPVTVETPFTGNGNLVVGTSKLEPGAAFKLTGIELTIDTAPTSGTQNLVITKDDGSGTAYYDNVIQLIDLVANNVTSLKIRPDEVFKATDVITAAWTNTDSRNYGLIFKHQLM